jgi:lambda family phage portal protein
LPQGTAGNIVSKYDAAGVGRRMRAWNPPASGPNRAIEGLQNIRNRSRDVARNDWSGESAIQKWTTNLIGVGITPRFKDKATKDLWNRWVPMADADGNLDFYGMQTLATRSWFDSGEVFGRIRPRRFESGMEVPMQVQLIEADYVPMLDADNWPGLPVGHTIRSGIERSRIGAKVAFWVYKEHPGDNKGSIINPTDLIRVAASEMFHMFEAKRPGQLRGVSLLAPVLARLRGVADFDDAALERQKLANLFVTFITRPMPENVDMEYDQDTGLPKFYDNDGTPVQTMRPGMSQELMPGEDVKFANPPEAGTGFSDYMRTQHLGTSAGAGLPYEIFSGDIKEVSDRTLRVIINEFRRLAEQRQWQIIIPQMCRRVIAAWSRIAGMAGVLNETGVQDALTAQWSPHGWQYIHPVQDVQGKKAEVDAGFRSRSSVISEKGDDPREVDDERKVDLEREKVLGLYIEPKASLSEQPAN